MTEHELLANLNDEQKEAVTHKEGPLLIIAGAGTGKTTVITRRIAWLIETGRAKPDEILALTFTEKASGEMEDRVSKLLPYGYVDLWVSTFHAFCERILHDHALDIGYPNTFKLVNETESWLLVRNNWDKFDLDYYRPLGNPTKFIQALITHFSRVKDEDVTPEQYVSYAQKLQLDADASEGALLRSPVSDEKKAEMTDAKRIDEVARAYAMYQILLAEHDAMDFGDLIMNTLRLLRQRPKILEELRAKFPYILVDEFQDTNYSQYALVKLLAAPKNNIAIVGDDDQSIFKFRGASISNILEFKRDYPESREVVLVKNYRSEQQILDLAYKFIQHNNPYRLEAQLNGGELAQEIAEKGKLLDKKVVKKLQSQVGDDGVIALLHAKTLEDEALLVAEKILELKNPTSNKQQATSISWSDFAILVRANDSAESFIRVLERANIPYQFVASRGLFQKPEVLDLLSYLRCLDNYHESRAVFRVLNFPTFHLSPASQSSLLQYAHRKGVSLWQALSEASVIAGLPKEEIAETQKILSLLDKHAARTRTTRVSQVALEVLQDTGYLEYLNTLSHADEKQAREKVANVELLFRRMANFEQATLDHSVKNFVAEMDLMMESGDTGQLLPNIDEGPDTVRIMTIHASKGLEFAHVFLVNMVDKRFPSVARRDAIEVPESLIKEIVPTGDAHLQEERRLFYVACTRAKKGLYLTSADDYGGLRKKRPSRFLHEAGLVSQEALKPLAPTGKVFFANTVKSAPEKTLSPANLPDTFSFTQLEAFKNCPYQYRFAHILKIPVPGKPSFSFGKTLHATMQRFFQLVQQRASNTQTDIFGNLQGSDPLGDPTFRKVGSPVALEELLDIYEQSWIDEWYQNAAQKDDYKRKGREYLKVWYESHNGIFPVPKYLERAFTLRIGEYRMKGAIDRVDETRDGVDIIDYKTGNKPKNARDVKKDQLFIYALAAEEVLKEKVHALIFYYLNENEKVVIEPKDEDIAALKNHLLERIEEIRASDFKATPDKRTCRDCDFNRICEFRAS